MSVTLLTWAEYHPRYGAVHDRTFNPGPITDGPFSPAEWARVLLPGGLYLDSDLLSALGQAAGSAGDCECVLVDRAGCFPDQLPIVTSFHGKDWDKVRSDTVLGHVEVEVFSSSGAWALIASPEGFALLGGTSTFMRAFLESVLGGVDELRARFKGAIALGEVGYGVEGERYAEGLLRSIGWM